MNKILKKSMELLESEFVGNDNISSDINYREFHKTFKREFTKLLKIHCSKIKINKANWFDISGFFETNAGKSYYFAIGDLRAFREKFLIRIVKNFQDSTGGRNEYLNTFNLEEEIIKYLT